MGETLSSVFARFLRFGFLAWGGPIAQIAMMYEEIVERERWMSKEQFNRVLGVYQALPGPEATELAVHFGYIKKGRLGGLLAGLGFVLPGFFLCLLVAWLYASYGVKLEGAQAFLYGLKAGVIGLILNALYKIGKSALRDRKLAFIAGASVAVSLLFNLNFLFVVFGAGLLALALYRQFPKRFPLVLPLLAVPAVVSLPLTLTILLFFFKAGMLTFGGAYTVIPFIQEGAVREFHWITNEQFLDAIALSGLLPAPLVIVGTFVGYLAGGLAGAVAATIGIFFPAFGFTLLGFKQIQHLSEHKRLQVFLDGLTASVVGIIFVATLDLFRTAIVDLPTLLICVGAVVALNYFKTGIAKVLLGSAVLGFALKSLGL